MRKLALVIVLIVLSVSACSQAPDSNARSTPAARQPRTFTVSTEGEPFALRFEDDGLAFCDRRGGRRVDLKTGQESSIPAACSDPPEPNTACTGLPIPVDVRAPLNDPNDVIDFDTWSVPLPGRVHDCAAAGRVVAVVTASATVLIDVESHMTRRVGDDGGQRVALATGWIAWSEGSRLRVMSLGAS